jgi:hypothetical protein
LSVQQIKTIGCSTPLFKDVVLRNEYIVGTQRIIFRYRNSVQDVQLFQHISGQRSNTNKDWMLAKYLVHYHHSKDSYLILKHLDVTDVNSMDDAWSWLCHIRILIIHDFNDSHIRKAKYFSIDNTFKKISSDWYQPSL